MSMPTDTRSLASAYSDMCLSTPYEAGIPSSAKLRATRASYDSSMRIGLDLVRLTLRVACGPDRRGPCCLCKAPDGQDRQIHALVRQRASYCVRHVGVESNRSCDRLPCPPPA